MSRRTGSVLVALVALHAAAAGGAVRPAPPAVPSAGWSGWERDLWLELQVDRKNPWLGEQVTASVFLVSPVGVIGIDGYRPPAYDGFWAESLEVPPRLVPRRRVVNGIPLHAFLVQRIALFPTRTGKLVIDPFQLDVTVQVLSGSRLFDPFRSVQQVRRRSAPVELDVKPLPPGAPRGFQRVNVGTLSLTVTPAEGSIPAGEPLALRVTARGEGNLHAWSLPSPPPIERTRRYDPTASEQLELTRNRVAGSRTVETLLVPERPGELRIPPLEWSFFDPKSGRYELATTEERRIPVTAGVALPAPARAALTAELRPIRSEGALRRAGEPPWRGPIFLLLLLLPPALYAARALSGRMRERAQLDASGRRVRRAPGAARRSFASALRRLHGGDGRGYVAELEQGLHGYVSDKLGRPILGLTRAALAASLAEAGAHPPAVRSLIDALEACDAARFGGGAPGEPLLVAATEAVAALEEADWIPVPKAGP